MTAEDQLRRYLEKGSVKKTDRLFSLFVKNYTCKDVEQALMSNLLSISRNNHSFTETIHPEYYTGNHPVATMIEKEFTKANLSSVVMILIHGSISTSEEIRYSDFDGVLIIDEQKITHVHELQELRKVIARTEKLMYIQDSLQHHGWKVLLKGDFSDYPDAVFPLELLRSGKIIYTSTSQPIKATLIKAHQQYTEGFNRIIQSLKKKCRKQPNDLFSFKLFCSELMLLPALFLQAKHHKTFSKRDSFDILKAQFTTIDQGVIDEVSALRKNWVQPSINFKISLFHKLRLSGIYSSALAPALSEEIRRKANKEWYARVSLLCEHFAAELEVNHQV